MATPNLGQADARAPGRGALVGEAFDEPGRKGCTGAVDRRRAERAGLEVAELQGAVVVAVPRIKQCLVDALRWRHRPPKAVGRQVDKSHSADEAVFAVAGSSEPPLHEGLFAHHAVREAVRAKVVVATGSRARG